MLQPSSKAEPTYNVVFLGPVTESSREQLTRGLQQRFKLTPKQAAALLERAPVLVKRGVSLEKAHSLIHHLEEIGAKVRIERVVSEEEAEPFSEQGSTGQETVSPEGQGVSRESYCPWEDMENLGFLKAFFATLGEVLFHPTRFYSRMPVDRGLINPLIFALVMGVLGGMFGLVYEFVLNYVVGSLFQTPVFGDLSAPMMIGSAVGLPILTLVGVFVATAVLHVCLMIVRGNRNGFEATFRVTGYAMSTQIFGAIPILGGLVGGIWTLVLYVIGLRESHGISTGRAAMAVFLPLVLILALAVALLAVMVPFILGLFS